MRVQLTTWQDLVDHLVDWMGANPTPEARRDAKRASLIGLREVSGCHNWTYYYTRGRISTVGPYQTGTIVYDHTGGVYERLVTLTGGIWPDWAAFGSLTIDNVPYEVYQRIDDTHITLSVNSNPGQDVTSTASWTLYRDQYTLPANFQSIGEIIILSNMRTLMAEHPSNWLSRQRIWRGTAVPFTYTVLGDPNYQNTLAIAFYPAPDNVYVMDYLYKRKPRELRIDSHTDGKVTAVAGQASLAGAGTNWSSRMVGSVIRLGSQADLPTARWGSNPSSQERLVTSVQSAESLSVDSTWDESLTAGRYAISDPVDVDTAAMGTVLLRRCELETGHARTRKDRDALEQIFQRELIRAKELDSRNFRETAVGSAQTWPWRLANFPIRPDS